MNTLSPTKNILIFTLLLISGCTYSMNKPKGKSQRITKKEWKKKPLLPAKKPSVKTDGILRDLVQTTDSAIKIFNETKQNLQKRIDTANTAEIKIYFQQIYNQIDQYKQFTIQLFSVITQGYKHQPFNAQKRIIHQTKSMKLIANKPALERPRTSYNYI